MPVVELAAHPSTPAAPLRIAVDVRRAPEGSLALAFRLEGGLDAVSIPPPQPPRVRDLLWQHTCFEAFVALGDAAPYHEFNLSPSGEWAVYAFRSYRDPAATVTDAALAPRITVGRRPDRLELGAVLALERLSPAHRDGGLRLGLSAVIEATDGVLSYWALRHPAGRPDFHHRDAFALRLGEDHAP